jgi:nucleoside-diphosphate-sugar epimerase
LIPEKIYLNPPTILITGAKGFTGLYLKDAAQQSGLKVCELAANLNDVEAL